MYMNKKTRSETKRVKKRPYEIKTRYEDYSVQLHFKAARAVSVALSVEV